MRTPACCALWLCLGLLPLIAAPRAGAGEPAAASSVARVVFRIEPEIDCPACEDRIKDLLTKTRGVRGVEIDVIANRMVVRYDPAACKPALLQGRVAATGYRAVLVSP